MSSAAHVWLRVADRVPKDTLYRVMVGPTDNTEEMTEKEYRWTYG